MINQVVTIAPGAIVVAANRDRGRLYLTSWVTEKLTKPLLVTGVRNSGIVVLRYGNEEWNVHERHLEVV